jgi:hypothetical protein
MNRSLRLQGKQLCFLMELITTFSHLRYKYSCHILIYMYYIVMDEFRQKLNHMLRFHRQRRFGIKTSFVTIDVSDTGKQICYMAGNNGLWVGIYRPAHDRCDGDVETLFSNTIKKPSNIARDMVPSPSPTTFIES